MPIYRGTTPITRIYRGTTPVRKVYRGGALVWQETAIVVDPRIAYDSFGRVSSNISGETTPVGGKAWSVISNGTDGYGYINNGWLTANRETSPVVTVVADTGVTNFAVSATLKALGTGGDASMVARASAHTTWVEAKAFGGGGTWVLYDKRFGSTGTTSTTVPANVGDRAKLVVKDGLAELYINDVKAGNAPITRAVPDGRAGFSFDSNADGSAWDDFTVEPIAPHTGPVIPPTIKSHSTAAIVANSATKIITLPANVEMGDLLISIQVRSSGSIPTGLSGFTLLASGTTGDNTLPTVRIEYKYAGASEPSSYTITLPSGIHGRADMFCIPGGAIHHAEPPSIVMRTPASNTTHALPTVSPVSTSGLLIGGTVIRSSTTNGSFSWSYAGSPAMTEITDVSVGNVLSMSSRHSPWEAAQMTGDRAISLTRSPSETLMGVGYSVVIPSAGSTVMSDAYVRSSVVRTAQAGGTATRTVAMPSPVAVGDLLLAFVSGDTGLDSEYALPAGWTKIVLATPGDLAKHLLVGYKRVTGDEGSTFTVSTGTQSDTRIDLFAVADVDPTRPPEAVYVVGTTNSTTGHSTPSVTPPAGVDRSLLFHALTKNSGTATTWSWTSPVTNPPTVEVADAHANGWVTQMVATQQWNSTAPTGTRDFTLTSSVTGTALGITILVPSKP